MGDVRNPLNTAMRESAKHNVFHVVVSLALIAYRQAIAFGRLILQRTKKLETRLVTEITILQKVISQLLGIDWLSAELFSWRGLGLRLHGPDR